MGKRRADRASDERILGMVRMRAKGRSLSEVARAFGLTASGVANSTNSVMADDAEHEPGTDMTSFYWARKKDRSGE